MIPEAKPGKLVSDPNHTANELFSSHRVKRYPVHIRVIKAQDSFIPNEINRRVGTGTIAAERSGMV
jgi:hypothetical protein